MNKTYSHAVTQFKEHARSLGVSFDWYMDTVYRIVESDNYSQRRLKDLEDSGIEYYQEYEPTYLLFDLFTNQSQYFVLKGYCTNVFIKDNLLFDFFINSPIKIDDNFNELLEIYPFIKNGMSANEPEDGFDVHKCQKEVGQTSTIVINHKVKGLNSIIVSFMIIRNQVFFYISWGKANNQMYIYQGDSDKKIKDWDVKWTYDYKYMILFLNLIYYADCFPYKIIDGVPDDFINKSILHPSTNDFYIEAHEKVINRDGVTPHYRRGHFRRLNSECFTKKRGKIIWVHEAMVKGYIAKTVIN